MVNLQNKIPKRTKLPRISLLDGDVTNDTRKLIIEEVESWVGTPFKKQGRVKGVGSDCVAPIIGAAKRYGYDKLVNFVDTTNYNVVDPNKMKKELCKYMDIVPSLSEALPADILHFYFLKQPQHLALLLPGHYIVHADDTIIRRYRKGEVVKHIVDSWWWSRVVGIYRFRRLEEWPNLLSA